MTSRLIPTKSGGVFERLTLEFTDSGRRFHITVRNGVAELKEGAPLPGSPEPVATLKLNEMTWRKLALKMQSPALAVASGDLKIDGSLTGLLAFLGRFDQEL
jgi:alkyl sulfatase BDS1-like metallo-beta-lactamase superfamily hydrolase